MKKKYKRKTIFEKKNTLIGSRPGSPGSWIDLQGRSGFFELLHWPVFCFIQTDLATRSTY